MTGGSKMPSHYAHYRFGVEMLEGMPEDVRKCVKRFRRLYDVGLHGPDLFFFYNPAFHTRVGDLGGRFHGQSGKEFFERVCRGLRLEPTEAGMAYLYGVLCHYCLDSVCHPFINQKDLDGPAGHVEIETEFDRFLLEKDGKIPPHTQDVSHHLRLTPGECATAAKFYPPANAGNIKACVRNMALCIHLLAAPEGPGRTVVEKGAPLLGKSAMDLVMPRCPNARCAELDAPLLALYGQAAERYPVLLEQIQNHMRNSAPLGAEFTATFG